MRNGLSLTPFFLSKAYGRAKQPSWVVAKGNALIQRLLLIIGICCVLPTLPVLAQSASQYTIGTQTTYTVQPGDTLGEIATRFGVSIEALATTNQIEDIALIHVGQVLIIPQPGALTLISSGPNAVVQSYPGRGFHQIAETYDLTVGELAALNHLPEIIRLFPGQPLLVPQEALTSAPQPFGALTLIEMPQALRQGQTGRLVLDLRRNIAPTVTWNGLPLALTLWPDEQEPARQRYFAPIPVPALLAPTAYELAISYMAQSNVPLTYRAAVTVQDGGYASQSIVLSGETSSLLNPEISEAETVRLYQIWEQIGPELLWTGRFVRPVGPEYPTTSPFGTRRSYNGGTTFSSYHAGQDFGAPADTLVTAPAQGIVALAEPLAVRGNAVIIDHGRGIYTGYWHLNSIAVAAGQAVSAGDVLGGVGTTGLSTGNHLHWEMRIHGVAVDPMQFLDNPLVEYLVE